MTREAAPSGSTASNDWVKSGTMIDRNGNYNHYNSNLGGSWNSSGGGVTIGGPLNHSSIKNHDDLVTVSGTLGNTGGWQLTTKTDNSHNLTEQDSKGGNGNYEIEVGRVHVSGTISLSSTSLDLDVAATSNVTSPDGTSVLTGGGTITHNRQHDYSASGDGSETVTFHDTPIIVTNGPGDSSTTNISNSYVNTVGQNHLESSLNNSSVSYGVINNEYVPIVTTTATNSSSSDHNTAVLGHIRNQKVIVVKPDGSWTKITERQIHSSDDTLIGTSTSISHHVIDKKTPANNEQSRSGNNHLEKDGTALNEHTVKTETNNTAPNEQTNISETQDHLEQNGTLGETPEADTSAASGSGSVMYNGQVHNSYTYASDPSTPASHAPYRTDGSAPPPDASNAAPSAPAAPGVPAKAAAVNGAVGAHAGGGSTSAVNAAAANNPAPVVNSPKPETDKPKGWVRGKVDAVKGWVSNFVFGSEAENAARDARLKEEQAKAEQRKSRALGGMTADGGMYSTARHKEAVENAKELQSTLVDLTPGVGTIKGIVEAGTGEDSFTDRALSGTERLLGAAGGLGGPAGAAGDAIGKTRRAGRAVDKAADAVSHVPVKPSLDAHKRALEMVHDEVGKLPKGEPGKFGSPQAGNLKKGYRLDPPHPDARPGTPESGFHINWWDWTLGKKGTGGRYGAIPIE